MWATLVYRNITLLHPAPSFSALSCALVITAECHPPNSYFLWCDIPICMFDCRHFPDLDSDRSMEDFRYISTFFSHAASGLHAAALEEIGNIHTHALMHVFILTHFVITLIHCSHTHVVCFQTYALFSHLCSVFSDLRTVLALIHCLITHLLLCAMLLLCTG